jgi:hypothetical protein
MKIIIYEEDFVELRHKIKKSMLIWITKLYPSDIRTCGDNPEVANTRFDDYLDETVSNMSYSNNSLLTTYINNLDPYQQLKSKKSIQYTRQTQRKHKKDQPTVTNHRNTR